MKNPLDREGMSLHKNHTTPTRSFPGSSLTQVDTNPPGITIGASFKSPRGKKLALNSLTPEHLKEQLDRLPAERDGWWSTNTWEDDHRRSERWGSAVGVMVDVDFEIKLDQGHQKRPLSSLHRDTLIGAAKAGQFSAQLFHLTQHGFRLIFVFPESLEDKATFKMAADGAMALSRNDILALNLPQATSNQAGFVVDSISGDLARIMRRPKCFREDKENGGWALSENELIIVHNDPILPSALAGFAETVQIQSSTISEQSLLGEDLDEELEDLSADAGFPKEVLPPSIVNILETVAVSCGVSFEMTLTSSFAMFCAAIGDRVSVKAGPILEAPLLWFANIAPSGSAKSPIARYFLAPIKRQELELKRIYDVDLADSREELARRKSGKEKKEKKELPPIDLPIRKRAYLTEATTEGLIHDLGNSEEPILYNVDEFPMLLDSADGYGKGGSKLGRSRLLSLWGREMIAPSRRGRQEPLCEKPFLIINAGAQPSVMRNLQLSRNDGLAARFLFVQPKYIPGDLGSALDDSLVQEIELLYLRLASVRSRVLVIEGEGFSYLNDKVRLWKLKAAELDNANWGLLSGAYGKAPVHTVRIMALLAALWENAGEPIPDSELARFAVKFLEFFLVHSRRCFQLITSPDNPEVNERKVRDQDRQIIMALRALRPSGEEKATSNWAKLLKSKGVVVPPRKLGKAFVRISELNVPGLKITRPENRSSTKKLWKILAETA